ncbi:MAG: hypothetical protein JWO43_617 [Candidatus Adlerbacteria bacterium]|nr:hypothetical protein [Candidatus Adlerbacteria bacterium]
MYELAIIGGGPAGVAAGVYAARKQLKSIFIAETVGGQSMDSTEIQNWVGTIAISGVDLGTALEKHLRAYAGEFVELHLGERATSVTKEGDVFTITTPKGSYQARSVLVATGGSRRKLDVPGASEFEHKGLTYCASCDGPLFAGQDVAVVGGGNAGFESAAQLLAYCKSVTLVHRQPHFDKADAATVATVKAHPNFTALNEATPTAVTGNKFVNCMTVKNLTTNAETPLAVTGIFVEIGAFPATDFVKDLVTLTPHGTIVTDPKTQRTSVEGVWAAGDCTDGLYHQNNIAAGDAVKALEDIYYWVKSHPTT